MDELEQPGRQVYLMFFLIEPTRQAKWIINIHKALLQADWGHIATKGEKQPSKGARFYILSILHAIRLETVNRILYV